VKAIAEMAPARRQWRAKPSLERESLCAKTTAPRRSASTDGVPDLPGGGPDPSRRVDVDAVRRLPALGQRDAHAPLEPGGVVHIDADVDVLF